MDRILGVNTIDLGGGRRGFRGKDTVAGVPGTELAATWHNEVQEELMAVIEKAGLVADAADLRQLLRGIRSQKLNSVSAGGTANALTVSFDPEPLSLAELQLATIVVVPASDNTGAMTVTAAVGGAKSLTTMGATALAAGDVKANRPFAMRYDGTRWRMAQPVASEMLLPPPGASTTRAPLLARLDARHTVVQAIPSSTFTLLNFGTTDGNSLGTTAWTGSRLTVGAGEGGLWYIQAGWVMSPNVGDCYMATRLRKNGSAVIGESVPTYLKLGDGGGTPANVIVPLDPGEYVEALAVQQTGTGQNSIVDYRARFVAMLLSAK